MLSDDLGAVLASIDLRAALPALLLSSVLVACADSKPKPDGDAKARGADAKPPAAKDADARPSASAGTPAQEPPRVRAEGARTWTFDDAKPGTVPEGFAPTETGGAGTPATWAVVEDPTAPTAPHAFGITKTTNTKATYNLALVEGTRYGDVDIQVMVKAGTGELDRGGGPVWRVKDEDNYYIARWNPLENNARFYIVQAGIRTALGKVELELDPTTWHSLRVVTEGAKMELFLDDKPVLRVENAELAAPGMIGLWTKADAATLFDDLSVAAP